MEEASTAGPPGHPGSFLSTWSHVLSEGLGRGPYPAGRLQGIHPTRTGPWERRARLRKALVAASPACSSAELDFEPHGPLGGSLTWAEPEAGLLASEHLHRAGERPRPPPPRPSPTWGPICGPAHPILQLGPERSQGLIEEVGMQCRGSGLGEGVAWLA